MRLASDGRAVPSDPWRLILGGARSWRIGVRHSLGTDAKAWERRTGFRLALGTSTLGTSEKSGRSPVSRILSLPPSRDWAIISLPACAGARLRGTATNTRGSNGRATLPLFCLAPREVCRAAPVARTRGGLLPHPFTLTRLRQGFGGAGLIPREEGPALRSSKSVGGRFAFCCTVCPAALTPPSPSFERRVALWCPDFPRPCKQGRDRPESGGAILPANPAPGKTNPSRPPTPRRGKHGITGNQELRKVPAF